MWLLKKVNPLVLSNKFFYFAIVLKQLKINEGNLVGYKQEKQQTKTFPQQKLSYRVTGNKGLVRLWGTSRNLTTNSKSRATNNNPTI